MKLDLAGFCLKNLALLPHDLPKYYLGRSCGSKAKVNTKTEIFRPINLYFIFSGPITVGKQYTVDEATENAGLENAGLENVGPNLHYTKLRTKFTIFNAAVFQADGSTNGK